MFNINYDLKYFMLIIAYVYIIILYIIHVRNLFHTKKTYSNNFLIIIIQYKSKILEKKNKFYVIIIFLQIS